MSSGISSVVSQLIAIAKTDLITTVGPAAIAFLNSMAINPSKLNLAVQVTILEAALLKALPVIEADELKALAVILTGEVSAALASVTAAPASAAAAVGGVKPA